MWKRRLNCAFVVHILYVLNRFSYDVAQFTSVFAICWMRESPMNTISDLPRYLLHVYAEWENLLWTQPQTFSDLLGICYLLDERIYEHNLRLSQTYSVFAICWMRESMNTISDSTWYLLSAGWENLLWTQSRLNVPRYLLSAGWENLWTQSQMHKPTSDHLGGYKLCG